MSTDSEERSNVLVGPNAADMELEGDNEPPSAECASTNFPKTARSPKRKRGPGRPRKERKGRGRLKKVRSSAGDVELDNEPPSECAASKSILPKTARPPKPKRGPGRPRKRKGTKGLGRPKKVPSNAAVEFDVDNEPPSECASNRLKTLPIRKRGRFRKEAKGRGGPKKPRLQVKTLFVELDKLKNSPELGRKSGKEKLGPKDLEKRNFDLARKNRRAYPSVQVDELKRLIDKQEMEMEAWLGKTLKNGPKTLENPWKMKFQIVPLLFVPNPEAKDKELRGVKKNLEEEELDKEALQQQLSAQSSALSARNGSLYKGLSDLKTESDSKIAELTHSYSETQRLLEETKVDNNRLKTYLDQSEEKCAGLMKNKKSLEDRIEKLNGLVKDKDRSIVVAENTLSIFKAEKAALKEALVAEKGKVTRAEEAREEMTGKLRSSESIKDQLKEELLDMGDKNTAEISKLKGRLAKLADWLKAE